MRDRLRNIIRENISIEEKYVTVKSDQIPNNINPGDIVSFYVDARDENKPEKKVELPQIKKPEPEPEKKVELPKLNVPATEAKSQSLPDALNAANKKKRKQRSQQIGIVGKVYRDKNIAEVVILEEQEKSLTGDKTIMKVGKQKFEVPLENCSVIIKKDNVPKKMLNMAAKIIKAGAIGFGALAALHMTGSSLADKYMDK